MQTLNRFTTSVQFVTAVSKEIPHSPPGRHRRSSHERTDAGSILKKSARSTRYKTRTQIIKLTMLYKPPKRKKGRKPYPRTGWTNHCLDASGKRIPRLKIIHRITRRRTSNFPISPCALIATTLLLKNEHSDHKKNVPQNFPP